MKVTDEAWAAQVERADNAEMREEAAYVGLRQVLREHDECICRHTRRILNSLLPVTEDGKP